MKRTVFVLLTTLAFSAIAFAQASQEDIDKAVHDLLQHGNLTITGADDMAVYRVSDVEYVETQGDMQYRHVGGLYRLAIQ